MRLVSLSIALLLSLPHTLAATVLLPSDFREIVAGSKIIVHGRVVDVRAEWVEGRSRIESFVTIESGTFFRGTPARTVTFRTPGGEVGGYRSMTVGAPEFRIGDEAVFFLRDQGSEPHLIFGLNQGVFRVGVDARTGRRQIMRQVLIAPASGAQKVVRGDRNRQLLTLDAFSAQLRSVLQQGGAR